MSRHTRASAPLTLPLAVLALLAAAGCTRPEPPGPRNVVLVLTDTLRADHLGVYGYGRDTSPFIDRLAAEGVLFEDVVSAAPATFPSVNSLFTSRSPDVFYHTSSEDFGIPEELPTLAELLRDAGFRTAAVSASPVVRAAPSYFNPYGGFGQGFEAFDESCGYREEYVPGYSSDCVTDRALEHLALLLEKSQDGTSEDDAQPQPFFLYVHYLDPHDPYAPPQERRRFSAETTSEHEYIRGGRTFPITRTLFGGQPTVTWDEGDIEHLVNLYDDEIHAVDSEIGRLIGALEERGVLDDTLVVLVSDHGESFLEHGAIQHGQSVYQSEIHVPLIFRWPGLAPTRRPEPVCSVDVMPTVLALLRRPIPESLVGVPLLGEGAPESRPSSLCFAAGRADWRSQSANLLALRRERAKIIYDRRRDHYEIYDLRGDPHEKNNLAPESWDAAARDLRALRAALDTFGDLTPLAGDAAIELDPEAERALRALGYIQ